MRVSTASYVQRGLDGILDQQRQLADIQEQVASGRRINKPSDDPTGIAQVIRLNQAIATTDQYQRNADTARNRLALSESTINAVENSLIRVRELAIQAGNSTLSQTDREALAAEVRERLGELLGLANTRDSNQEYLYSGNRVTTRPFSQTADGGFIYHGDQGQRALQISSGRQIPDGDSGHDLFVDIKNGNGTFQVNFSNANTGDGIFSIGSLIDSTAYVVDDYTISFVTNANGNLAYNVVGANSGQVIPPLPQDAINDAPEYVSGGDIQFNGIQTSISGTPALGDTFTVTPSQSQDIFTTLQEFQSVLEGDATGQSGLSATFNGINQAIANIDLALENVFQVRAELGARLKTIDDQTSINDAFRLDMQTTLSGVQDLDYTAAIVELQSRLVAIEAAQLSYNRLQGLSLFNFLS